MSSSLGSPYAIEVHMKIGVLHTIAKSIYSDPKVKLREAVANSMDNDAKWFILYADRPTRTISLMDNGTGITNARFREIFGNLGCALQRDDAYSNSYFGLGLMSVLQFGSKATIITKSRSEGRVLKVTVDSERIFSDEMRDKPIGDISHLICETEADLAERVRISPLTDDAIVKVAKEFPSSFTEILLEGVDHEDFNRVTSEEFATELRKLIPLKSQKNEPFFGSIKDTDSYDQLMAILGSSDFCPTIDVHLGVSEGERELTQLWKYYPDFRNDLEFGAADIDYGISNDGTFAYYYLYSTDDLEERTKVNTETGFWVRNKNFLVKEADYFQRPGLRKKIINDPLKNWLFGEVFHRDMTDFLVVTRDEYIWESPKFKDFYNQLEGLLLQLNTRLRDAWKNGKEVIDSVVNPFIEIGQKAEPFISFDTLQRMGIVKSVEELESVLAKLGERRRPELEDESLRIDRIIDEHGGTITLTDNESVKALIDPKVDPARGFVKQREADSNRIIVRISPQIFAPQKVKFLGIAFKVYYVAAEENLPGISIDIDGRSIYVNPFNQDMARYSVSFVDVCVAAELADIYSETKEEMKRYLLELLGARLGREDINPRKYLFSLRDELQRRRWAAQ